MTDFTDEQKLKALEREFKCLSKTFSIWIDRGKMQQKENDERLAAFDAVMEDYRNCRRFRSLKDI